MPGPQYSIARYKATAIAMLAASVILFAPVASASADPFSHVTAQQPGADTKAKVVPNVVGMTAYAAKNALAKAGLKYAYKTPKGSFVVLSKNWTVTKQSPKANSKVAAGSKIKLTVVKTSTLSAGPSASAAPAAPTLTTSQRQAVIAAKAYLSSNQGFSYQGLIDQLSSPYGNGFPVADATLAVTTLNPDFNAQAVLAANAYLATGIGFSHASLVDQLTSAYGSQFTPAQAEYAAAQVGL